MAENGDNRPDLETLAGQYMDLWQKQLEGLAGDPAVAEMTARALELMNAGPAAFSAMTGAAMAGSGHDPDPGPEAAAPAHGAARPDLSDLARRLDELERRVAALEAGPGKRGKRPSRKT